MGGHSLAERGPAPSDGARTRHEIARGSLGEDSCLDGMTVRMNPLLRRELPAARCQQQLEAHKIDTGNHLRYGMLDLEPSVNLHEIKLPAFLVVKKLDRTGISVSNRRKQIHRCAMQLSTHRRRQDRGRRLFDHLLVAALNRAVSLAKMHGSAGAVSHHLNLHVPRAIDESLEIERAIAKRLPRCQ